MLLYIHGFNSSPQSEKAVLSANFVAAHHAGLRLVQPQLPADIDQAASLLCQITEEAKARGEPLRFIGSSLGGFFATYLAETYGGKAALINPAVSPYDLFETFLGPQHNPYTGEDYQVLPSHREALKRYDVAAIANPDRFFVLLQTGDEVLDYRLALGKYHCCRMLIEPGGDHSFVGFERQLPDIAAFLELP
ncbi:YqiA/YcfP family alpha/beta fold hydrolase [Shewanella litorisediminis]|uniref:Esterase YqiA n=1 Tax=Shewanella litorisediminis TaxID=1173586 RepID=A0ABX7G1R2_9GAMM|nr:YqiA/YcfP family alpha/beta fold hydrolase [Shewanella litorisediminis]MCL2918435.1 esterase YqiA [Shewanella litorisediminis]QRH01270.1 esterase YqiA [Shewanella litorisediminis]